MTAQTHRFCRTCQTVSASKAFYLNRAASPEDVAALEAHFASLGVIIETKPATGAAVPPKGDDVLSPDELAICSQLGLKPELFLKSKKQAASATA